MKKTQFKNICNICCKKHWQELSVQESCIHLSLLGSKIFAKWANPPILFEYWNNNCNITVFPSYKFWYQDEMHEIKHEIILSE